MAKYINLDGLSAFATKLAESLKTKFASKQDTLVSGTNIKTVNGETVLGSGDITIESGTVTVDGALNILSENPVTNAAITNAINMKQDALTIDSVVTEDSDNPVSSSAIYTAIVSASDEAIQIAQGLYEANESRISAIETREPSYTNVTLTDSGYEIPANDTTNEMVYIFNTDSVTEGEEAGTITAAEGVQWLNGEEPSFSYCSTVLVSVVKNLAVWGEFQEV